jgi:toxin HigB-1
VGKPPQKLSIFRVSSHKKRHIENCCKETILLDSIAVSQYYSFMIKSFKSKETEKVFHRDFSRKLQQNIQRTAYRRLALLHSAKQMKDLLIPPSNQLEKLYRDRLGQHSIRINDQWRVCFRWQDGDAYEVEIVDYH